MKLLLVEDEKHLSDGIRFNLEKEKIEVVVRTTVRESIEFLEGHSIQGIILDLMLPDGDGSEVLHFLNRRGDPTPVLILSAKNTDRDRITGLRLGVDDYLGKPFHLEELILRTKKMLKMSFQPLIVINHKEINLRTGVVTSKDGSFSLTEQEVKLLRVFLANEGKSLSRNFLLNQAWDFQSDVSSRTVDNFVGRLRKYFENDIQNPELFYGIRGVGYGFKKRKDSE